MKLKRHFYLAAVWAALLQAGIACAADREAGPCGRLYSPGQYGPYDHRNAPREQIDIVLGAHFTSEVENLQRGSSGTLVSDIDYTLRALPNYARALAAITRLAERMKTDQPPGARYSVDCYFERALRFRPDDQVARMLYANLLIKRKRMDEAVSQLDFVSSTADPENALTYYNLGLLYLDAGQFSKARDAAVRAQELGKSVEPLRERLQAAGQTLPPSPEPPADAASASASASAPVSAPTPASAPASR